MKLKNPLKRKKAEIIESPVEQGTVAPPSPEYVAYTAEFIDRVLDHIRATPAQFVVTEELVIGLLRPIRLSSLTQDPATVETPAEVAQ